MPSVRTGDGVEIHYRLDDFRDPWIEGPGETIVMSHGFARSMVWWTQWAPALARRYRVLRYDIRGCGRSSVAPEGTPWSADRIAADVVDVIDALDIDAVHWVGFESGGPVGHRVRRQPPRPDKEPHPLQHPRGDRYGTLRRGRGSERATRSGGWASPSGSSTRERPAWTWPWPTPGWTSGMSGSTPRPQPRWQPPSWTCSKSWMSPRCTPGYKSRRSSCTATGPRAAHPEEQARVWGTIADSRLVTFPDMAAGIQLLIPDRCTAEVLRFLDQVTGE